MQHFGGAHTGGHAVFVFFVLSGFLMTLLVDGPYRDRPAAFALNRALRLYPGYWLYLALTAGFLALGGPAAAAIMRLPEAGVMAMNIAYLNNQTTATLIPTAWAVTNEILFYALIGAGLARTPARAHLWLAMSLLYVGACILSGGGARLLYFSPLAASLPFSVGAVVYHHRGLLTARRAPQTLAASLAACVLLMAPLFGLQYRRVLLCAAAGACVLSLYRLPPSKFKAVDDALGALSYPIYLNHFLCASLLVLILDAFGLGRLIFGPATLASGLGVAAMSIAMASLTSRFFDRRIDRLRRKIRKGAIAPVGPSDRSHGSSRSRS